MTEALTKDDLLPLGTRMRVRLSLDYAARDELAACLDHLLSSAVLAARRNVNSRYRSDFS